MAVRKNRLPRKKTSRKKAPLKTVAAERVKPPAVPRVKVALFGVDYWFDASAVAMHLDIARYAMNSEELRDFITRWKIGLGAWISPTGYKMVQLTDPKTGEILGDWADG